MKDKTNKDVRVESKQLSFDFSSTPNKPAEIAQAENSVTSENKENKGRIIPLQYHLKNELSIYRSILNWTMQ